MGFFHSPPRTGSLTTAPLEQQLLSGQTATVIIHLKGWWGRSVPAPAENTVRRTFFGAWGLGNEVTFLQVSSVGVCLKHTSWHVTRPKDTDSDVGNIPFALARFNLLRSYYRKGRMAASANVPSFLESFSPWTSRSTTPKPSDDKESTTPTSALSNQNRVDHSIDLRHRLSLKDYPSDCPKPNIRWFYAVDVSFIAVVALRLILLINLHRPPSGNLWLLI